MISVIISIYNKEDCIHICLNSLIKQTYTNFEVICIDNASTDDTPEILDYFSKKDSRIKVYKNKKEEPPKYCKNKGVELASGDQILFLEPTEWLSFNTLELISQKSDNITESTFNNILDYRKETQNIKHENEIDNYKKSIRLLKNERDQLQKKLGKLTKSNIINKIINEDYSDLTIAIKSPHPEGTTHWGELFFSTALKKSFEKLGFNVIIQEREHWYDETNIDIALVLRGEVDYYPDYSNINIMWNISHPNSTPIEEYEKYDYVFIASDKYANKIKNKANTNVHALLQCTDPDVFYPEKNEDITDEILFVGVTRGVYRRIIKDVLKTDNDISIYGMGWEEYIDEKYVKGYFIPNEELHKYYSSCKILLNDHWNDMIDEDFPSNRLFDALSCGAFVISDEIPAANDLFEGTIVTYNNVDDLNEKINYYLAHEDERIKIAKKGQKIVLENHTFDHRVKKILSVLREKNSLS